MSRKTVIAAIVTLVACSAALQAQSEKMAVGGMGGTLGLGAEWIVKVSPDANLRFGAGVFNIGVGGEFLDVAYDFDTDLLTFPVRLDWYPFESSFHVTGGLIINRSRADLSHQNGGTVTIGGTTYLIEDVGSIQGNVTFTPAVPYLGIGWGNAFGKTRRWGLISDVGLAYVGSPNVALEATGPIASSPGFQTDLARERADLQDDLDNYRLCPVLSLTLYFRF